VDFEFTAPPGERPTPLCLVAREVRSGALVRRWLTDRAPPSPPFDTGADSLFIAYYASAELGCFLALGWPFPARVLDLFAEFRNLTCGLPVRYGYSLLGALAHFKIDAIARAEKKGMHQLAMRGGPYTGAERAALLNYCQTDVDALARLLPAMLPDLDLPRALLRARYMAAAARMEWNGVPIDVDTVARLRGSWDRIKGRLVAAVNRDYGVYVPAGKQGTGPLRFSEKRWAAYLATKGIPWPLLDSGRLDLEDDTFKEMARAYPDEVGPIRELRHALSQMRLNKLAVGSDGRNRCLLSAFGSKTSRNQPSNAQFIFGPSVWLRFLICFGPGRAGVYLDWRAQEYGIAAAKSGDAAMWSDYQTGDPYLAFAKRAGAVPPDATKETHERERDLFKVCCGLGAMYGAGEYSLAARLGISPSHARELLQLHRQTYPTFWRWSDAVQDFAMSQGYLDTTFGWRLHVGADANPRSLRNFLMQGNGAEMMRLACCLATERGVNVCCPVHDALLVEGPADDIEAVVAETQWAMREASELVLPGFPLDTDAKVVRHPDRYFDKRGRRMWELVQRLLTEAEAEHVSAPAGGGLCRVGATEAVA
jgi:hypothetical protein